MSGVQLPGVRSGQTGQVVGTSKLPSLGPCERVNHWHPFVRGSAPADVLLVVEVSHRRIGGVRLRVYVLLG